MNSRYIVIFVAITTITTIGAYTYNEAMASHAFEGGTAGGALPIATTVIISGEVMQSGDYMPLVDFSPNFVAGHLLLRIPCDAQGIPRVFPVAGHIDETAHRTYTSQPQMNLIEHVSNKGKTCVYHSHVPAIDVSKVGNPGAPRITDVGLMNTCNSNIVFGTANVMSFTVLRTLGDINSNPYGPEGGSPSPYNTEGPTMPKFGDMLSVDVHRNGNVEQITGNPCA